MMIKNPYHPGAFIREFLAEHKITPYRLAKDACMPMTRVDQITKEKRSVTPDTAMRLARYFSTSERYWLNLQASYDLGNCRAKDLDKIKPVRDAEHRKSA